MLVLVETQQEENRAQDQRGDKSITLVGVSLQENDRETQAEQGSSERCVFLSAKQRGDVENQCGNGCQSQPGGEEERHFRTGKEEKPKTLHGNVNRI